MAMHKLEDENDSRKGMDDDMGPNDFMIKFSRKNMSVYKRQKSTAWDAICGLNGGLYTAVDHQKCFYSLTRHGGRFILLSIELKKEVPGKLWPRLMRDEREANRPNLKWDKDMQKSAMITDKGGKFVPSTFCNPDFPPKWELEDVGLLPDTEAEKGCNGIARRLFFRHDFEISESTQAVVLTFDMNGTIWRMLEGEQGGAEGLLKLTVSPGGTKVNFCCVGDEASPMLQGTLGGAVWRSGARWFVQSKKGELGCEVYLPKQTPEPWPYIVKELEFCHRWGNTAEEQMMLDGLWEESAVQDKHDGDEKFRNGEYRAAVLCYNRALDKCPDSFVTLTNRAAAALTFETEKMPIEHILEDAQRALEINPDWAKARFREGVCYKKLKLFDKAQYSLESGQRMAGSLHNHPGWEEELEEVKAARIAFYNKPKTSYMNRVD